MGDILAVVVLYESDLFQCSTYKSLLEYCGLTVFVYDNSRISRISQELPDHYIYVHNPNNAGVSAAYNRASQYALVNGFEWILILDQDTIFPHDIISEYRKAICSNPEIQLFAPLIKIDDEYYLSPSIKKHRVSHLTKQAVLGKLELSKFAVINSGMLIQIKAFFACGGYNEKVWLDFSDHQFTERFQKHSLYFYVINAVCFQNFSNQSHNVEGLVARYGMFCSSLKYCEKSSVTDHLEYLWIVWKRACSLILRTRKVIFIKIFFKDYLGS